jgi:two-component system chemotaxis response regulator CheB
MINVLLITNAPLIRGFLEKVAKLDPGINITDFDKNQTEKSFQDYNADIVVIDAQDSDRSQITSEIMQQTPCPILVLVSQENKVGNQNALACINTGALDYFEIPSLNETVSENEAVKLTEEIRFLSKISVFPKGHQTENSEFNIPPKVEFEPNLVNVVGIGASTGGPKSLVKILKYLPDNYPIPVVIVQHIVNKFLPGLIEWFSKETSLCVKIADNGEKIKGGTVYFAPNGIHTIIDSNMLITFDNSNHLNGCKPSIDVLFSSLAESFGEKALGIILTGMGKDGAAGAAKIRASGGQTIAQDEASSTIFGMPRVAIDMGAIDYILPPREIAEVLLKAAGKIYS